MNVVFSAFIWGLLFAIGLGLAGMTQPAKIIGFLDVAGDWNPSLLFVMGGAVMLGLLAFPWIVRRDKPLWAEQFHFTLTQRIDRSLIGGSAIFGVGWGLAGYCPGPALVALIQHTPEVEVFIVSMIAGLYIGDRFPSKTLS